MQQFSYLVITVLLFNLVVLVLAICLLVFSTVASLGLLLNRLPSILPSCHPASPSTSLTPSSKSSGGIRWPGGGRTDHRMPASPQKFLLKKCFSLKRRRPKKGVLTIARGRENPGHNLKEAFQFPPCCLDDLARRLTGAQACHLRAPTTQLPNMWPTGLRKKQKVVEN